MQNVLKITFVILGTIIGAGFSSGQEILSFFNKYGVLGLIGLIFSIGLIGIIIYKTLKIINEENINSYQKFIEKIIPEKLKQNKIIIFTINNIVSIFLLISFNIMVAGFSTYFLQEFGLPKIIGSVIIALFSFLVFSKGVNGIIKINTYVIPIILMLIVCLGIKNIDINKEISFDENNYWLISSILYSSYNSICLIPVLIGLKKYVENKKQIRLVCLFTFIIMLILSLIIFLIINSNINEIVNIEIPIVYIAGKIGILWKYVFGIYLLIAIFTTAISSGYGFLYNITSRVKFKRRCLKISFIMCLISLLFRTA